MVLKRVFDGAPVDVFQCHRKVFEKCDVEERMTVVAVRLRTVIECNRSVTLFKPVFSSW